MIQKTFCAQRRQWREGLEFKGVSGKDFLLTDSHR